MSRKVHVAAALLWVLVVFYPNPTMLFATIWRTWSPAIDGKAAEELAATLPDDPNAIRDRVLSNLITYDYDWNIYNVPWYFPSATEAIRDRRGDCESQAVVLASILDAKHIPYQLKMSFDHMWVDYETKKPTALERDDIAVVEMKGDSLQIKIPQYFDLQNYINIQLDARWHPMPIARKVLLLVGLLVIMMGPRMLHLGKRPEIMRGAPVRM